MDKAAAGFGRVVDFWNGGPLRTADDAERIFRLFEQDPGVRRTVYERDPRLSTPFPVERPVFFAAPAADAQSWRVDSGSAVNGEPIFAQADPVRGDGVLRWADGRPLSTSTVPLQYVVDLERDRESVGSVLADLLRLDDAGAHGRAHRWALAAHTTCVAPFALYDPQSPTRASLWLNGVATCCGQGVLDFIQQSDLHPRLHKCGAPGCPRYVFTAPGSPGRPRAHCCDDHAQRARDATRRRGRA